MDFTTNKDTTVAQRSQHVLFQLPPVGEKKIELSFSGTDISSDGGLLLLKECEKQSGIIEAICKCIEDDRNNAYVHHSHKELLTQRIFQIAAGYEDANDCNSLRKDNILKLCNDRLPGDKHLASQPTMSRFENSLTNKELYAIAQAFLNHFISSYGTQEPPVVILDCDDTNTNAYGEQQLCLYNDYYGEYCFMPLHIYEGISGKLITTILKPGRRSKNANVFAILKRIIAVLRAHWKNTTIIVRGDGHFCSHQLMDWCKTEAKVHFLTGLTGNKALEKLAQITINSAQKEYKRTQKPVKYYHSFEYKAGSWQNSQRVIVKVEINDKGKNIRYIVTDMRQWRTQQLYERGYCARGAMELRIKEHKTYLQSDRMSCTSFKANQFRLFMHSAAYVLLHTLQKEVLHATEFARSTFKTIREKLIKVAAYVTEMKTKIKIELPASCPQIQLFAKCFNIFAILNT